MKYKMRLNLSQLGCSWGLAVLGNIISMEAESKKDNSLNYFSLLYGPVRSYMVLYGPVWTCFVGEKTKLNHLIHIFLIQNRVGFGFHTTTCLVLYGHTSSHRSI